MDIEKSRDEARDRLQEAWTLGRIDATEHERRTTALRHAASVEEIESAERGHLGTSDEAPGTMSSTPIPPFVQRPDAAPASVPEEAERTSGVLSLPPKLAGSVVGLTPFLAAVLFFAGVGDGLFPTWLWFLLIPVMGILVYGPDGEGD